MALCPGIRGWVSTRKVKPIWILLKQYSGWQWHQLDHTSLQTDNHASTPPLKFFLQVRCPSCYQTNSVIVLKAYMQINIWNACYTNTTKQSYFVFFETVHLVFWHLVLPLADCVATPTELVDVLLLATSDAAVTDTKTTTRYSLHSHLYKNTKNISWP